MTNGLKKKTDFAKRNDNGFTLVEVMIATALVGFLSIAGVQLISSQFKASKKVEGKFETDSILNDIRSTLGARESCIATLGGQNAVTTAAGVITQTKQKIPAVAAPIDKFISNLTFASAAPYGQGSVRLLSYRLSSTDPTDSSIGMVAGTPIGSTNLIIRFAFNATDPTIEKKIRIDVVTASAADRTIVNCASSGAIADFDDRYVNAIGDQMTGNLVMTNNSSIEIQGTGELLLSSDRELKYDIHDLASVTAKLKQLRPVNYKWKANDKKSIGLIAQEVQAVFPGLVHERSTDGRLLSIDYVQLSPIIIKALQETIKDNEALKAQIKKLNSDLGQIKAYICKKEHDPKACRLSD